MTPFSIPDLSPEQAAELLRRMQAGGEFIKGQTIDPLAAALAPHPESTRAARQQQDGAPPENLEAMSPEERAAFRVRGAPPLGPQPVQTPAEMGQTALQVAPMLAGGAAPAIAAKVAPYALRALTASPMATAGATGAVASTLPNATGKTPWEVMQGGWDTRRQALQGKIEAERAAIAEAEKATSAGAPQPPKPPAATANIRRGQNAAELFRTQMEQFPEQLRQYQEAAETRLKPRREAITGFEKQMADIDEEIKQSQLPIREKYPGMAAVLPPLAWAVGALTGGKIGKFARGLQEQKAEAIRSAAERGATQLSRGRSAFTGPQGRASAGELQAVEGTNLAPISTPVGAALAGGAAGAAEGILPPLGLTAMDAILAPGGSPLAQAASEAPMTQQWWMQTAPEAATTSGTAGMAALLAALKQPSKGFLAKPKFGPPSAPTGQVSGLAAAARAAQPKPKPKAKKEE